MASSRLSREAYAIGIICALYEEKAAVEAMLDERHEALDQKPEDTNSYTFGKIGRHNVVIACLPGGSQGTAAAATVAIHMTHSFPIKLGLMVGIGGGVPSQVPDIRLGDVVVSLPVGTHGGVIQYDFGKMELDGFRRKGHLDKPPKALLSAVTSLRAKHELDEPDFPEYLIAISKKPRMAKKYGFQGSENDQLFDNNNQHVVRDPREDDLPQVFYGTIGSGNMVMKDGEFRDLKAADDKIICFEMEAAGLMNDFPCLVIRGISDYADSRKNDRWQPYAAATAAAYAKELLSAVSVQEVAKLGPARKHLVPFSLKGIPAIDHFVQRDKEMQKLEDFFLNQTSQPVRRKVFVVHGLGGIGKTQLCIEFARKHQAQYTAVLWMDGSSEDALQQSFVKVFPMLPAEEMSVDLVEAVNCQRASPELVVKTVLDWLSLPSNQGWLHIIDNVDHDINAKDKDSLAYDLAKYSARVDHGSLLITSRLSTLTVPQNAHQLTEMNLEEARALFEEHRGKSVSDIPARDESVDLESLLGKLEGMPLALAQAGAFIRQTNISIREYLDSYNSTWDDLITQQDSYPLQEYAQRSMLTTWKISYQQVESESLEAATLLKLWAFLDPKDLWYELIACAIQLESEIDIPEWLSTLAKNRLKFRGALGLLRKYSLVNNGRDNDNYSMHAVLHSWCRHLACMSSTSEAFLELAMGIVTQMSPGEDDNDCGILMRRLFPHGQQLLYQLRLGTIWTTLNVLPTVYAGLANLFDWNRAFEEAAEVLEHALEKGKKIFGEDDLRTLNIAGRLVVAYCHLKKHAKAQKLAEHCLAVCEKLLISDPGRSAAILEEMEWFLQDLGTNYLDQMRLEDAEGVLKRAIALSEQQQEQQQHTEDGYTLDAMIALGGVYDRQARLTEAEVMFERASEVSSKLYGPYHRFTLSTLVALSGVYDKLGKVVKAKEVAERAAAGFDKIVLEDQHPRTRMAEARIRLFRRQGKFAEAIVFAKRVLKENEERLGPKHRDTLSVAFELAHLYDKDNRLQEARSLHEQLIPKFEDTFGLRYHGSLKVMENLAYIYIDNFKMLSEAEELFKRVLTVCEEWLGPNHSSTLLIASGLAYLYKEDNRSQEARSLYEELIPKFEDTFGLRHNNSLRVMEKLAIIYVKNFDMLCEAEELFKRVLTVREEWLSSDHIDTLSSVSKLSWVYNKQGDQVREVEMCERALLGYKNTLGPDHEETLKAAQFLRQAIGGTPGEFSMTSRNIILDNDFNLVASCQCMDGSWLQTSISLNDLLENQGGHFAWNKRGNFVAAARNIRLSDYGMFLVAELVDNHGVWKDTRVDLDERIANHDGKLTFVALGDDSGEASIEESGEVSDEESVEESDEELDEESAPATSLVTQEHSGRLRELPAETTSLARMSISAKLPRRCWWRRIGRNKKD
ncbi:purine and uridine phosphorylase, partial [Aureobasidium melanogenum]